MHLTFNLECNKVRQDISVKQENIPDKKDIRYNATNQKITYNTKAKEGHQPDNFSFLFLQIPYKIIKSITARQQKLTLHLLLRLRNSINSHIRNQYYYFFSRILINTLLPSSSIQSACFRISGSSEDNQASNNS